MQIRATYYLLIIIVIFYSFVVKAEAPNSTVLNQSTNLSGDTSTKCETLLIGPPRGLACLHCLQPEAKTQAEKIIELLKRACIKNVAINFLLSGGFSSNPELDNQLLIKFIDSLVTDGRSLHLFLYFADGSSQRRWQRTKVLGFPTKISPTEFRKKILDDNELQSQYQQVVKNYSLSLKYAQKRAVKINIVPMLEDNLSNTAFLKLVELTAQALPPEVKVSFGRNPCKRCYAGNEWDIPQGYYEEVHQMSSADKVSNGLITNDGEPYKIDDQNRFISGKLLQTDLSQIRDLAGKLNSTFILWDSSRQGLDIKFLGSVYPPPAERNYKIPHKHEEVLLIEFLRGGFKG